MCSPARYPTFTAIAFDAGGVASGPMTAAFMLPFAMGITSAVGGDVMTDAFGLVAMVAMMPLITVQVMGAITRLKSSHADDVMDAARAVGATGGTIIHAKGTGERGAEKFFGMSISEEKDIIYILAASGKKSQIMKAVNNTCGVGTKAGAVCFSLPVSEVVGIRRLEEDEE